MSKLRLILLSLTAVVAVSAVVSTAAFATSPEWLVNNAALGAGGKAEFEQGLEVKKSKIKLKEIVVECAGIQFGNGSGASNALLENEKGGKIKELQFTKCKVTSPASGCKITAETIKTKEINLDLNSTTLVGFLPAATTFAEFTFANETGCKTLKGLTVKVTGETEASANAACEVGKELTIAEAPSKLKAAGAAVEEFDQTIKTKGVNSGQCYGAQ